MRFTSVGPKWRAALQSSLLSLSLPSPSCPLGGRHPLPLPCRTSVCPFVRPSIRYLSSSPVHLGPRGTAQTVGMHQMHRADRYPSPFHRFHLFTSAVCLSLLLPLPPPPSPTPSFSLFFSLSLLHGPSFLFSPVGYSASAGHSRILYIVLPPPPPLPLPSTDRFSTTGVVARLFSSTPSSYVRPSTNARTHARNACGPVRRRGTLCRHCRGYIPGRPSRRVLTTYVLAPSRRAFSFSLLSSR